MEKNRKDHDETLYSGTVKSIYEEVTRLYARESIPYIVIADRYVDPRTGIAYSLARLSRQDAIKHAEMGAGLAISRNRALFDERELGPSLRPEFSPAQDELVEVVGRASVTVKKPGGVDLVEAMGRAELNARSVLAQRMRLSITNDVEEWINAQKGRFAA